MPQIDLPTGYSETAQMPKTRTMLKNCFNNGKGEIIATPGIDELGTTGLRARGQFVWNGNLYRVDSTGLLKVNVNTGTTTTIGTIDGTNDIVVAIGFNHAVIVVKDGRIYTVDKSDVLTRIDTNSNFEACDAVTHIDGRFVYIPSNGANPAFFSDVGAAGTVQAASFFDAEELPDQNTTTFQLRNTLYIGGTDSFELFRNTGASPVPFQRLQGARIDYGFIGGLIEYADTYLFIGREKDQDYGIYAIEQGRAAKISNEAIDLILSQYNAADMSNAIANRFKWRGYDIATFEVGTDSFGFYKGEWFILSNLVDGVELPWSGGFINQFKGVYYSAYSGFIGKLSTSETQYSELIPRVIDVPFPHPDNEPFACQSIALAVSQGFNAAVGTVGLAVSRNNVEYGPFLFRDLGALGKYTDQLEWNYPGGLGSYDGFMGIRIYTTQAVDFNARSLFAYFRG